MFAQEAWMPADVTTLTDAVADTYPHARFLDPRPDEPGAEPAGSPRSEVTEQTFVVYL